MAVLNVRCLWSTQVSSPSGSWIHGSLLYRQDVNASQGKGWVLVSWSSQVQLLVCNIFFQLPPCPPLSPHATPPKSNPDQVLSSPSLSCFSLICIRGIYYVPWW